MELEATLPPDERMPSWVRDAVLAVEGKQLRGISPGFQVPAKGAERLVPEDGEGDALVREILDAVAFEYSIVSRPAYPTTEVDGARVRGRRPAPEAPALAVDDPPGPPFGRSHWIVTTGNDADRLLRGVTWRWWNSTRRDAPPSRWQTEAALRVRRLAPPSIRTRSVRSARPPATFARASTPAMPCPRCGIPAGRWRCLSRRTRCGGRGPSDAHRPRLIPGHRIDAAPRTAGPCEMSIGEFVPGTVEENVTFPASIQPVVPGGHPRL